MAKKKYVVGWVSLPSKSCQERIYGKEEIGRYSDIDTFDNIPAALKQAKKLAPESKLRRAVFELIPVHIIKDQDVAP